MSANRTAAGSRPELSVVVPVFRNAATLAELARRVNIVGQDLGGDYELLFVDDASPDGSAQIIADLATRERSVRGIVLAKNVGQYRAVQIGLQHTLGEWVAVLDADLQDPPEAIPVLLEHAREGYQVVFAGRRGDYQAGHRMLSSAWYKRGQSLICGVPNDAGMYMLLGRSAVDRLLSLQGVDGLSLVISVGLANLSRCSVPVARDVRAVGGSAYSSWQRVRIGMRNLTGAARWRWWPGGRRNGRRTPARVVQRIGIHTDYGVGYETR